MRAFIPLLDIIFLLAIAVVAGIYNNGWTRANPARLVAERPQNLPENAVSYVIGEQDAARLRAETSRIHGAIEDGEMVVNIRPSLTERGTTSRLSVSSKKSADPGQVEPSA